MPEWRIVDDETWLSVHEIFQSRRKNRTAGSTPHSNHGRAAIKYPLSGIARCGHCGGSIGSAGRWWRKHARVTAYACLQHHTRGKTVCPVTVYQSSTEIEAALLDYLRKHVLTADVVEDVLAQVRKEIAREFEGCEVDTSALKKELRQMRQQQKRLARAIAMVDDARELLSELQKRRTRIGYIEAKLAEAERLPGEASAQMEKIEATARERLTRLDQVMAGDRAGLREVFLALFPEGLTFRPYQRENRQVWAISGSANLGGFNLRGDPNGI